MWASVYGTLCNKPAQNAQGNRADNLQQAIYQAQRALEVNARHALPE